MSEGASARLGSFRSAWLASYAPEARRYDELLGANGEVRGQWRPIIERIAAESSTDAAHRRLDLTRRLIAENGVTYNIYADPQGADRPWVLDPLPLVLRAEEWREIEQGVLQRAHVLDSLLADLYGPQSLLAEGCVPAALAYGHPNFLWPCRGIVPRDNRWLHIYAADLARGPNGRWWLLADRTQAPSGAGYALENREIIEQVLPEPLRDMRIRRIREFFESFREQLLSSAQADDSSLAVILTPGPLNETYFEHAYLARQLGVALAEGHDLTVRDDTVYLKTLGGLRRVHTIYRRLDDDYCDPVELRSDSALGVPGLLGAARAGQVVLANALGSGVLESAAWLGFMPGIAQRLTNEALTLPSVATWWCGEQPALEYVLANLDQMVIKPTYPNQRFEPVFGHALQAAAREELIARLRARPYAYVAQEHLPISQAPTWRSDGTGIVAKPLSLRVYVISTPDGRMVMPGGLVRVATDAAMDVVSTQRGGGSKDVWVLTAPRSKEGAAGAMRTRPALSRSEEAPSRLVENLYWFGRYSVRCEEKARVMRATLAVGADEALWRAAVNICGELGILASDLEPAKSLRDMRDPYSIVADVKRLGWCASQVRSRLSNSFWRASVELQQQLHDSLAKETAPREALDRLLLSLAALAGYAFDHMTRDDGWRLMRIGRRLERMQFVAQLLGRYLQGEPAAQQDHLEWLLDACDSSRVYRSRYVVAPRLAPMLDLLLRDVEQPHALGFQHHAIGQDLAALAAALGGAEVRLERGLPLLGDEDLALLELDGDAARAARAHLATQLLSLSRTAGTLSDRISMRYFSHVELDAQALAT